MCKSDFLVWDRKRNHLIRNLSIIDLLTATHSLKHGLPLLSVKVKPGGGFGGCFDTNRNNFELMGDL